MYQVTMINWLGKKSLLTFFVCWYITVLDVQAFERLLGPCMDIMKRSIDGYEEQLISVFGSKAAISDLR
jgi:hypothetical protein